MVSFKMGTALIIANQGLEAKDISKTLTSMGYGVDICNQEGDIASKLSGNYELVLITEDYLDTHPNIEEAILNLPQKIRRNTVFILISNRHKTLNPFVAFLRNFNAVINLSDLPRLSEILSIVIDHHNELYRGFKKIREEEEFL